MITISFIVFRKPMFLSGGCSHVVSDFDLRAIGRWFKTHTSCRLTNGTIKSSKFQSSVSPFIADLEQQRGAAVVEYKGKTTTSTSDGMSQWEDMAADSDTCGGYGEFLDFFK